MSTRTNKGNTKTWILFFWTASVVQNGIAILTRGEFAPKSKLDVIWSKVCVLRTAKSDKSETRPENQIHLLCDFHDHNGC